MPPEWKDDSTGAASHYWVEIKLGRSSSTQVVLTRGGDADLDLLQKKEHHKKATQLERRNRVDIILGKSLRNANNADKETTEGAM